MSTQVSLPEMLADLERRFAFHREQEETHAQQETLHRDERARHAAAAEAAAQQLAALQAAASGAEAFLREAAPLPVPLVQPEPKPETEAPSLVSRMIALVIKEWPADRSFGARAVTAEVNRRFAEDLRRPVSVATVGRTLLRFGRSGKIRAVREGVSHRESLYKRIASR